MADTRMATADLSTLDRVVLEALIAAQQQEMLAKDEALAAQQEKLLSRDNEIEHLKLVIAKLRRMIFGTSSEKVSREIEQLELKLEELETHEAERVTAASTANTPAKSKPTRRPLPEHLPREVHTYLPAQDACPDCGGELRKLGEDVSEILERVPATYKVIRHVRVKMACTQVRCHCPGTGTVPAHRTRTCRAESAGARAGLEVCRPSSVVSPVGDLRSRGYRSGPLHAGRLGRCCQLLAGSAGGSVSQACVECNEDSRG